MTVKTPAVDVAAPSRMFLVLSRLTVNLFHFLFFWQFDELFLMARVRGDSVIIKTLMINMQELSTKQEKAPTWLSYILQPLGTRCYGGSSSLFLSSQVYRAVFFTHAPRRAAPRRASLHKGAFCQFTFQWIHYYDSNKSTGLETGKSHLCAMSKLDRDQYIVKW